MARIEEDRKVNLIGKHALIVDYSILDEYNEIKIRVIEDKYLMGYANNSSGLLYYTQIIERITIGKINTHSKPVRVDTGSSEFKLWKLGRV